MSNIDKHMLRPIAEKLYEITDEMWNKINSDNRELVEEYLKVNNQRGWSPKCFDRLLNSRKF